MKAFADLIHHIILSQSRNRKLDILTDYFINTPDPERGYTLAILTGNLAFPLIKPSQLKTTMLEKIDPLLYALSYDYVGDLAETIAYLWPSASGYLPPSLDNIVLTLQTNSRQQSMEHIIAWLNVSTPLERWALIKLIIGGLRIGLSERLAKMALSQISETSTVEEIEELWHGLEPPYIELFQWLTKKGEKPIASHTLKFRPLMLAHQIEDAELSNIDPSVYAVEWKWDGIRVQLVGNGQECRLYSRSGEDISHAFPDIIDNVTLDAVLDGELLVKHSSGVASFNDLQQRLNRKKPSKSLLQQYPAFIRLYDVLIIGTEDLRNLSFKERRNKLECWLHNNPSPYWDLSGMVHFTHIDELKKIYGNIRLSPELQQTEGFMLKRYDSPYLSGRIKGHWYKWKRNPLSVDLVMMYAQRGHGKRSSYYSDYTFGAWAIDVEGKQVLVPVAKAYSGFTDAELIKLDKWVRSHTKNKFGPVREVTSELVVEIEFDSIQPSKRHKSGLAMRFPRVHRIRWDKLAAEADTVDSLKKLI